jgi:hypothetical protein
MENGPMRPVYRLNRSCLPGAANAIFLGSHQFEGTGAPTHRNLYGPMVDQVLAAERFTPATSVSLFSSSPSGDGSRPHCRLDAGAAVFPARAGRVAYQDDAADAEHQNQGEHYGVFDGGRAVSIAKQALDKLPHGGYFRWRC